MFHVKQKTKSSSFFGSELGSLLSQGSPFFLKNFDFRLLPCLLPLIGQKTLVFYDSIPEEVYRGLLLFFKKEGLFFQKKYLKDSQKIAGFSSSFDQQKEVFFGALEDSFKNHSFVFLEEEVWGEEVFEKRVLREEFYVGPETKREDLVSSLVSLGFSFSDIVDSRGQFCDRGLVVDFFPKGYHFGVRVVFDDVVEVFSFDVDTQLVVAPLDGFYLVRRGESVKKSSLEDIVSFNSYKKVFIGSGGVSFFEKSPTKTLGCDFKSLSLEGCLRSSSSTPFESLCLVGFSRKGRVFVPSWTQNVVVDSDVSNSPYVDFSKIERGDYVVHSDFGVGKYCGLSSFGDEECMVIKYQKTTINVYPSYFNRVSFYKKGGAGDEEGFVEGGQWKRRVRAANKAASDVAADLVRDYLGRSQAVSDKYYLDKDIENRLLDGFEFKDTKDQALAWVEIKKDLLSSSPMERLLCGDVGFGKTELAIRACFLSSINGFGSLVLAPTTVLAKQLFSSFSKRLSIYGISVGLVSRFVKKREQDKTISLFLDGKIDVLVGTHRIIFNEPCLKKASLVVVDDEHRFGVRQKEGVKKVSPGVNILYMSATPIPRTLKMALSDITSISTLSTPPSFKLPTTTSIDIFSSDVIKEAVLPEVSGGGQVFFIHNQVKTIPSVVSYLKNLFPSLVIDFMHGQEESSVIEKKMDRFLAREVQVLVASSIVENGIDIPSVNTIIVNNAHMFGVSQLYQLRGRVGRSSKPSFAFLLIPSATSLSFEARERLKIIQKNSSLGSFYAVSLEDLSLRGGGAVFGYKQSGAVGRVGFELYDKFLNVAVKKVLGEDASFGGCVFHGLKVGVVPKSYISSDKMRIWFYKELSSCENLQGLESFVLKASSVFGPPPPSLKSLITARRIEIWGQRCFFIKIIEKEGEVRVFLDLFFWKNKIEALFTVLFGYKFTLLNAGKGFSVVLKDGCVLGFLKCVFMEIEKNVK